MSLSEQQRNTVKDLKSKGYSEAQVLSFFGANEMGRSNSSVHKEERQQVEAVEEQRRQQAKSSEPIANKVTEAMGLGGATQVFGDLLSRSSFGNLLQSDAQKRAAELNAEITGQPVQTQQEINRQQIEAPTGKEIAGAAAQTAVIPAGAVLTGGGSLAGQMAMGAGLGYIYDVGGSFAEQEDSFAPGAETIAGALVPPVLRGAGAAFRGAGTLLARSAPNMPTPTIPTGVTEAGEAVVSKADDFMTPLRQTAREYAVNRPGRLLERAGEAIQETREAGRVYETASPTVRTAMDAGLDNKIINAVSDADDATKQGYKQIVEIAESGSEKLGTKVRPEIIAGDTASEQYSLINNKRKEVGSQIGEAIDNLPKETYNATPLYQEVDNILRTNGITPARTAKGVQLDFTGSNVPPKQRETIQSLYNLLTETGDTLTARQLYNKDRLLSQLQREARFDGVSDVMVKTPDGQDVDLFRALREVFSAELEGVAPSIAPLNKEYAQLRGLQDDIESTIFKSGNYQGTRDIDPAEFAQTNLRRLFSDAQSAADYRKIYDNLDAYSRALGYEGARADDLVAFATEMRKIYPDSVPATSATGIWGSIGDVAGRLMGAGKADVGDQQKAMRALLEIGEESPPSFKTGANLQTTKSLTPEQETAMQGLSKRLSESSKSSVPDYLKNNKQGGFVNWGDSLKKSVNPEKVASLMDDSDFNLMTAIIDDIDGARMSPKFNGFIDQLDLGKKATNDDIVEFLKRTTNEYETLNPPKATTKTTDLVEEAKGKTLDEFVKAQGTPVYHGTSKNRSNLIAKEGFVGDSFFSTKKSNAEIYSGVFESDAEVIEAVVNIKKPAVVDVFEADYRELGMGSEITLPNGSKTTPSDLLNEVDTSKTLDTNDLIALIKDKFKDVDGVVIKNVSDPELDDVVVAFTPDQIKTRTQLEDIWNKANKSGSLLEEAKKYTDTEINFVYNTKKADLGQDFAQDVEPAGRYMNVGFDEFPGGEGMVKGTVTFKKPLVIEWETSRAGGWKTKLSEQYGGKTGKELSQAVIDDGYDGIIAVTGDNPKEAVNLQTFRK